MLNPLTKPCPDICTPDNVSHNVSLVRNNFCSGDDRQHWASTKGAFHQSFDEQNQNSMEELSNSCVNLNDPKNSLMIRRSAFSSSVGRDYALSSSGWSGPTNSPVCSTTTGKGNVRIPVLGGRSLQSSSDSNGVGQISMNLMRANGAIAPFKALLTNLISSPGSTSPIVPIKSERSASSQYLSSNVNLKKLHKIGSHYVLENTNRKDGSPNRLFDAPIVNVEGEQESKKSLSLVLSEDLEGERTANDGSESPLMRKKEASGGRLIRRQSLFHVRRVTSDYALFFATIGIALMIIDSEMTAAKIYQKGLFINTILKVLILLSTIVLVVLVVKFHVHEVQLFMNANSAEDWRIAITWQRGLQIALEVMVCAICPLPIDVNFQWTESDGDTIKAVELPLDVFLSIPMFFRLYWLCRVMLLHSRLFTDASSRSIAGLNRVNFNARFILKTLMTLCPGTVLMVFTASLWVIAGWILRLCERHYTADPINIHAQKHQDYLNSLWLIAITFLSVGYGDIVPNTYCGRAMAVITGILGTCTSSMVVAVIARKLELTRAEMHVHNFMMDTQLTKQLKHTAANVLRETWLIYKHRCLVDRIEPAKIRMHQRKFLVAIYALRKVKRDQRKLTENSVALGDIAKTASNTYELVHDVQNNQEGLSLRMTAIEYQLADINRGLSALIEYLRPNRILKNANLATSGNITSHDNTVKSKCNAVES